MKTQGEKIKTQGENKDRGKNIIYFPPVEVLSSDIVTCSTGKILFDFPLAIFSPQYTACESRKIIAWPKGEK